MKKIIVVLMVISAFGWSYIGLKMGKEYKAYDFHGAYAGTIVITKKDVTFTDKKGYTQKIKVKNHTISKNNGRELLHYNLEDYFFWNTGYPSIQFLRYNAEDRRKDGVAYGMRLFSGLQGAIYNPTFKLRE